jgi:hypothetical protein
MHMVIVERVYNGEISCAIPPEWLEKQIESLRHTLYPNKDHKLVCWEQESFLHYAEYVPCNGGYRVTFLREPKGTAV